MFLFRIFFYFHDVERASFAGLAGGGVKKRKNGAATCVVAVNVRIKKACLSPCSVTRT